MTYMSCEAVKLMDKKPGFSRAGYLHRIYMSYHASLFVIVEGIDHDRYLVDRICRSSKLIKERGYEIRHVRQIRQARGVASGGKSAVLSFYDYCRRSCKLTQHNSGGPRSICFFVDRDGQQLTGGTRRSPHVVYTRLADSESHIFSDSDETEALAAAASLDRRTVENLISHIGDWKRDLATAWRPWIEECYVAEAVRARCWVGFGSASSRVHTGTDGRTLDAVALNAAREAIKGSALITGRKYDTIRTKILHKIAKVYESGNQVTLLKGKWLPAQLTYCVAEYFDGLGLRDEWNKSSFRTSVIYCYLANLDIFSTNVLELRGSLESLLMTASLGAGG
jgi:hypothetical protein